MYIHFPNIINTCSKTGKLCKDGVWATSRDAALAGDCLSKAEATKANKKLEPKAPTPPKGE